MQFNKSPNALKDAFEAGFNSFYTFDTTLDSRGKMKGNPPNPYYKGSLVYKDFERGFNAAYFKNQNDTKTSGNFHDVGQDFSGN